MKQRKIKLSCPEGRKDKDKYYWQWSDKEGTKILTIIACLETTGQGY